MFSADNFNKQFGPRSIPTKRQACSGSKLFDTLMSFLKELFETVSFEYLNKNSKGNLITLKHYVYSVSNYLFLNKGQVAEYLKQSKHSVLVHFILVNKIRRRQKSMQNYPEFKEIQCNVNNR